MGQTARRKLFLIIAVAVLLLATGGVSVITIANNKSPTGALAGRTTTTTLGPSPPPTPTAAPTPAHPTSAPTRTPVPTQGPTYQRCTIMAHDPHVFCAKGSLTTCFDHECCPGNKASNWQNYP